MSQRRPRAKDPPPGGFSGKRPSGFVAPRSQTAAGMLLPVRKHLVAPRHPAFCPKTGSLRILKQALMTFSRLATPRKLSESFPVEYAKKSVDHRHHRTGRLVSGGIAFVQGL